MNPWIKEFINNRIKEISENSEKRDLNLNNGIIQGLSEVLQYYEENKYFVDFSWTIDDVKEICNSLNNDECFEVLQFIEENHDANIGINWDVIRDTIEDLFPEKIQ